MLGILAGLIISWLLLYLVERRNILCLGFLPLPKRLKQFAIGFLVTASLCGIVQYSESLLKSSRWSFNENHSLGLILKMFWWDFKSVLTEELIFRGALLFILLKRIGSKKAILVSAISFGIYHWFSFGIFGYLMPMFFVFVGTGLMGYAWALAFSKTKSILMPLGLHLGWNFTFNTIFSKGPLGEGLLMSNNGSAISDWFSLIGLWVVPLIVLLFVKYFVREENEDLKAIKVKVTAG